MAAAGGHWLKVAQGGIGKLVFVPKGRPAGEAITGRRPSGGGGFPKSLDEVQKVKGLGGSTGAVLVQDNSGNLYVQKKGANSGHLIEESAADTAYEALGVDVPQHQIYLTSGGPVKLSKFVEGQTLDQVESKNALAYQNAVSTLKKNFVADAVLGNWDVIGLGKDNIMVGTNGKVYRIDNGGSLRYRAQGALKASFGEFPTEIFSMRVKGTAGSVFGSLKMKDIAAQARSIAGKQPALVKAMPKALQGTMTARVGRLRQLSSIYKTLSLKSYTDKSIDGFLNKLWDGLSAGTFKLDPKTPADVLKAFDLLGG